MQPPQPAKSIWPTTGQLIVAVTLGVFLPWVADFGHGARLALTPVDSLHTPESFTTWAPRAYRETANGYETSNPRSRLHIVESGSDSDGDGRRDLWYAGIAEGVGPFGKFVAADTTGDGVADNFCVTVGESPDMIDTRGVYYAYQSSVRDGVRGVRVHVGDFMDQDTWCLYTDFNGDKTFDLLERRGANGGQWILEGDAVIRIAQAINDRMFFVERPDDPILTYTWREERWESSPTPPSDRP